jgi:hypothetical protein
MTSPASICASGVGDVADRVGRQQCVAEQPAGGREEADDDEGDRIGAQPARALRRQQPVEPPRRRVGDRRQRIAQRGVGGRAAQQLHQLRGVACDAIVQRFDAHLLRAHVGAALREGGCGALGAGQQRENSCCIPRRRRGHVALAGGDVRAQAVGFVQWRIHLLQLSHGG